MGPVSWPRTRHLLAERDYVEAEDFRDQILITYPVEQSRLDMFSGLLSPARVEPRGVWYSSDYITRPNAGSGMVKRVYAAIRAEDEDKPYMAHILKPGRETPVRLHRGQGALAPPLRGGLVMCRLALPWCSAPLPHKVMRRIRAA
ncbi:MAG: hypothetical protein CSA70_04435 [Rhodobacterales bacterium]|nr:MAG: hypothetical protein CSA70_04435 [Rhodobacterales bacterium]